MTNGIVDLSPFILFYFTKTVTQLLYSMNIHWYEALYQCLAYNMPTHLIMREKVSSLPKLRAIFSTKIGVGIRIPYD